MENQQKDSRGKKSRKKRKKTQKPERISNFISPLLVTLVCNVHSGFFQIYGYISVYRETYIRIRSGNVSVYTPHFLLWYSHGSFL